MTHHLTVRWEPSGFAGECACGWTTRKHHATAGVVAAWEKHEGEG